MVARQESKRSSAVPRQRSAAMGTLDPGLARAVSRVAARLSEADGDAPDGPLVDMDAGDERLVALASSFDLDADDLALLVVPVAVALDPRIATLAADSAEPTWPTVGTAFRVCGLETHDARSRARLSATAPLVRSALVHVEDVDRPLPLRRLSVDERLVAHLLGDDGPDPAIAALLAPLVPTPLPGADRLAAAVGSGTWLCWLRENTRASGFALAAQALEHLNARGLAIDLRQLPAGSGFAAVARAAVREATLAGAALVVGPVDLARDRAAIAQLADPPCPVLLVGPDHWNPHLVDAVPFVIDAVEASARMRLDLWREMLGRLGHDVDPDPQLATYRLTPEQLVIAAASAVVQSGGAAPRPAELSAAARMYNAGRLERLVRRVTPVASFDDLVLGESQLRDVREVIDRYRTLDVVRGTWGVGGAHRARGVTCLFYGVSGTGKTLSAEVIAHELGVDLFVIDLSQVVDKYIGETEKNLERIFSEAENVNGVLFFDEADALFGKRSEVRDAHDRHANVEVAYLLQRMERFEGVAVLATNLQAHIDEAFSRRLDVVCDFRTPDEDERRRLWRLHLPPTLPQADDIDIDALARAIDAPGGVIRNITLAAAHAAAAEDRAVTMADLVRASLTNHRKRGRLLNSSDFAMYLDNDG